jgi:putative DNA primase/helicase
VTVDLPPERSAQIAPCTDLGNGERFAARNRSFVRYCDPWKVWLVWDGGRWLNDERCEIADLAKETIRAIHDEARASADDKVREHLAEWAWKSERAERRRAMIECARSEPGIAIVPADLDRDPWLFNCSNGTINLRTGKLREHDPNDLLTKLSPVDFDLDTKCPLFDAFLLRIMAGDTARIDFLQAFLGYCMTGDVREHVLTFWYGSGGNGKSVLAKIVMRVLGDYAQKAAPDLLFGGERNERHPAELADLFGARFVLCNETRRALAWDEARLKDITGGDTIKARRMRENFWGFEPTHKLAIFGNHRPRFHGTPDGGVQRRLRMIPFDVVIPKHEIDRDLDAKLWAERSGVLGWLVRGCLAWQRDGLPEPAAVTEATQSYFASEDQIGNYFAERCTFNPDNRITRKALREDYDAWCAERDEKPAHPRAFADELRKKNVRDGKVRGVGKRPDHGWHGVALITEPASEPWTLTADAHDGRDEAVGGRHA